MSRAIPHAVSSSAALVQLYGVDSVHSDLILKSLSPLNCGTIVSRFPESLNQECFEDTPEH